MIWKLLVSAALAAAAIWAIQELRPPYLGNDNLPLYAACVIVAGYHRNFTRSGRLRAFAIDVPTVQDVRVRYTMWGVPVSGDRRVRIAAEALTLAKQHPLKEYCREAAARVAEFLIPRRWPFMP